MTPPTFTFKIPNLPKRLYRWLTLSREQTGASFHELICVAVEQLIRQEELGQIELSALIKHWRATHEP